MLLLTSASDLLRIVTGTATDAIEVHASYVDLSGATVTPLRTNTRITTADTVTVVDSPAASTQRNVKGLYITNTSAGTNCRVEVLHTDGANSIELMGFTLLPGENMTFSEEGRWTHRDKSGAEYPPAGLGAYNGRTIPFMKTGTAADTVGYWYCTAKDGGFPGAWAPGTPGINGRVTDGTQAADFGCVPISNPGTGANFITELVLASNINHSHLFFDCLWVNSGIVVTTTTLQAISSPTLPARDVNGSSAGEGCMIAMLTTTANTNSAAIANATVTYTNSQGVSGRTARLLGIAGSQITISPVIGTITWFNLDAGDTGVQSIEGITLGTSLVAGAVSLMICRDVATIGTAVANVTAQKILGTPGVRLYNGTCLLHCYLASSTTASFINGELSIMER
ncbi:hypothetical protein LHU53_15785 [Rhodoferax sp. U2-2l]|uniref:hypothetical protein n=1 Tax=Rhodoferax sp. U2-2l TaxID=2884000 RepID=UPI001D0A485B|nr:hypothetical protein [Rhodoferax sp. U2-2l]MCB8748362.1 hypothetical protein [Rhodoferax sp. U2-2l]